MAVFIWLYGTKTWSLLGKTEQNYCLLKLYLIQWKHSEAAEKKEKKWWETTHLSRPLLQQLFPSHFFFHKNKSLTKVHLSFMTTFALLLSWCLIATETTRLIMDRERGYQVALNSSSKHSNQQRLKRLSATARTMLKRWGPCQRKATCLLC